MCEKGSHESWSTDIHMNKHFKFKVKKTVYETRGRSGECLYHAVTGRFFSLKKTYGEQEVTHLTFLFCFALFFWGFWVSTVKTKDELKKLIFWATITTIVEQAKTLEPPKNSKTPNENTHKLAHAHWRCMIWCLSLLFTLYHLWKQLHHSLSVSKPWMQPCIKQTLPINNPVWARPGKPGQALSITMVHNLYRHGDSMYVITWKLTIKKKTYWCLFVSNCIGASMVFWQ